MNNEDFKKLLQEETPKEILKKYMFKGLNLREKQLGIVIDLKNGIIEIRDVLKQIKSNKKRSKK